MPRTRNDTAADVDRDPIAPPSSSVPEPLPSAGGSYVRREDGTLERIEQPTAEPTAPEA
jgi:hypothetical protein